MRLLAALFILSFIPAARAELPAVWVTSGFFSKHLTRDSAFIQEGGRYRESNAGIGVEVGPVYAGTFRNSMDRRSRYLAYAWRPLEAGTIAAGVALGVMDGYRIREGGFFPIAVPHLSASFGRVGANLVLVPKVGDLDALVALQFKFRLTVE